jgi:hypothetical protein
MTRHTQHLTSIAAIAVAALALSACNSTGDPGSNTTSDAATNDLRAGHNGRNAHHHDPDSDPSPPRTRRSKPQRR